VVVAARTAAEHERERAVSHERVGPPRWAALPHDGITNSPCPTVDEASVPAILRHEQRRCRCGAPPAANAPERSETCTIFTLTKAFKRTIVVTPCGRCNAELHQFAGPDLGSLGMFNYNNKQVFSHTLLNEYTARYSSSETPFNAFCTSVLRTYHDHGSSVDFVKGDRFRDAWFAFARIQDLGDSFRCDICGPNPEVVIADGVTAGFQKRRATYSLRPPTCSADESPRRLSVKPVPHTMLVPTKATRVAALNAVRWRRELRNGCSPLARETGASARDVVDVDREPDRAKARRQTREQRRDDDDSRMEASLGSIAVELSKENTALGDLFLQCVRPSDRLVNKADSLKLELLQQVS
jgi:hypothetical protein